MLKTFDNRVTLDIDQIIAIDAVNREDYGYRQYVVHFRGGGKHVLWCEPAKRFTLEQMYPEFTEWFRARGEGLDS